MSITTKRLMTALLATGLLVLVGCGGRQAAAPVPQAPAPAPAAKAPELVHWKFVLDWAVQGPQSPFLLALDKGYFAKEGISLVIDRGFGSGDAVTKVATGAYQLGFADINSMIEYNAKNPGKELIAIAVVHEQPPFSIMTLKKNNIRSPKDLEGKTLGAPAGDAPRRLFPMFAKAAGIDPNKVTWKTVDAPLREAMLIRGEVEAISGFNYTSLLNLEAAKVEEADVVTFLFSDLKSDLYGNSLVVSPALAEKYPDQLKAFVRAIVKGWQDTLANPDEAIGAIKRRDSLIDDKIEKRRLMMSIQNNMLTPAVKAQGFSPVDMARLGRSIEQVTSAFGLEAKIKPEQVYTDKFLPSQAERMPPK